MNIQDNKGGRGGREESLNMVFEFLHGLDKRKKNLILLLTDFVKSF